MISRITLVFSTTLLACGSDPQGLDGGGGGEATPPARAQMFVTSEGFDGNFAEDGKVGVEAADRKCTTAAASAGLTGEFVAFISPGIYPGADGHLVYSDVLPESRVVGDGPWYAVGSDDVVFQNRATLTATEVTLEQTLRDEHGASIAGAAPGENLAWTGVGESGAADASCDNWSGNGQGYGTAGRFAGGVASQWRYYAGANGAQPCYARHRLYCFSRG